MALKQLLIFAIVAFFCVHARKNAFHSLCALLALVGLMENRDWVPRSLLGIPGLNPWNILLVSTVIFWRRQRSIHSRVPGYVVFWFSIYCIAVFLSTLRLLLSPTQYIDLSTTSIIMEYFINGVKFILPAVMFYDLCDTKEKVNLALIAITAGYLVLALQIINYMGISDFSGSDLNKRGVRVIARDTGYHRVDASMMLAGASWAIFALTEIYKERKWQIALLGCAAIALLGQVLTGGRAGYLAWAGTGMLLCLIRWRKLLPIAPVAALLLIAFMPGIRERLFSGFADKNSVIVESRDDSAITSGRSEIWPYVVHKIQENPIVGYGREGMKRSGLTEIIYYDFGQTWGHPHNAYLQLLIDNGIIGAICILPIYFITLHKAFRCFISKIDGVYVAAGGVCIALISALFIASIGSQTFYPRQGMLGLWCAMGLIIRIYYDPNHFRQQLENQSPKIDDNDGRSTIEP